ncbi:MAG TPA: 2-oxoacid:acceptor oxidoreductase family protein [Desulfomonilaceae bacterium]|nr:2-oxoacid:acceptor oxidoreductase family protein [Desulfomonilaceae bacterium]
MRQKAQSPLPFPRIEVRLAGSGGQGLILAGLVLAEAAGVFDGREVAMVQSYGPEARGGTSKAEVIISDSPIDYPLCTRVDLLLSLNQEACDAFCWDLKPAAWILVDKDLVTHPPSSRAVALPFTAVARDKLNRVMVANVVALGAIAELTGIVTRRSLERSLLMRAPAGTEELNRKALSLGTKLARDYSGKQPSRDQEDFAGENV